MEDTKIEETNTDIGVIDLTKLGDINNLRKLIPNNNTSLNKNNLTNVIRCKFNDFTFDVDVNNVKIPPIEQGQEVEITIEQPENLKFQEKNCNADKNSTIKISGTGEYLRFDQFKFQKQPFNCEEINGKTIFDNLVETNITEAFGYNKFDAYSNDKIEYNFPLHYNAHGIFKIPVKKEINKSFEKKDFIIKGRKYQIDDKSAILFKAKDKDADIRINNQPAQGSCEYIAIYVNGENQGQCFQIDPKEAGNIKNNKLNNTTQMKIEYGDNNVPVLSSPKNNDTNFFAKCVCSCCNQQPKNQEPELNTAVVHKFENIAKIEKSTNN